MMGPIPGKPADASQFTPFRPAKVLYELDTPRTFTFVPADGELYLAHWFDESEAAVRYLVVPFSPALVARLEAGQLSLREAIDQPRLWVVDVDNEGVPAAATRTTPADLPMDELPVVGTLLSPALEAGAANRAPASVPAPAGSEQPSSRIS
jgi:hypothetical protein